MKVSDEKLNYFSAIRFLGKYMKGYRKHFIMFYTGWLVDSVLVILLPVLFGIMIDEIVYYRNLSSFVKVAILFLVCILFSGGLYFLLYAQHGYLMNMFVFSVRRDIFDHLQKCDAAFLVNASTGELLALLQDYPGQCMHFVIRNMIHFYNGILMCLLYGIYLLRIDLYIGMITLAAALLSVFVNTKFKKKISDLGNKEREAYGKYIGWVYEVITALCDIRMLRGEKRIEEKFEAEQKTIFKIGIRTSVLSLTAQNLITFVTLFIRLTIYGIAAYMAVDGNMTLGTLTVVFTFYEKLAKQIANISQNFLDGQNRVSYIQSIYRFLHAPTEPERTDKLEISNGEILFSNISFGYEDDKKLLKNITMKIRPGEHVAIVGKSGCGKTTLASLLIGFYRAKEGYIAIDGQRLETCDVKSIRSGIGYVLQEVLIFNGTIRENLLMGNLHAEEEDIIRAYRAAGMEEFINSLPEGLNTVIGSHGTGLSGGQKQRIAIARIYLKNPKVVIFDEATSALDNETESAIHHEWKKVLAGKTAIIIAHRQSSVMFCDRVIMLEDGTIAETGSPDELAEESERFQTLFAIKERCGYEETNAVPV